MRISRRDGERHSTGTQGSGMGIGREEGDRGRRGELGKKVPLSSAAATFSSFF